MGVSSYRSHLPKNQDKLEKNIIKERLATTYHFSIIQEICGKIDSIIFPTT
jgi:hypothetical protein